MRLLIAAGLATLLGTVFVAAQDLDQGGQSQSEQILKKKKKKMDQPAMEQDQGQNGGNAQSSKKKLRQETLTDEGDQNTGPRKLKKRQQATGNETDQEDEAGQAGGMKKKKLRKTGEDQPDQATRKEKRKDFTALPAQKRDLFRKKLVMRDVQRVRRDKLKFRLGVGIKVPRTIRFYPLPPDVIEFVPAYRGYLYFLTEDGLVVIVDPRTFEIVSVFPA
jgi:hypothetical protein